MQDKSAVITGATSGIGLQSAIALAQEGAFVIGVGRSKERCVIAEGILRKACPTAQVCFLIADLSSQRQLLRLADDIRGVLLEKGKPCLDVLVNNAGTFSDKLVRTDEGVELVLAVNHLAPFLLTRSLLPALEAAPFGRVLSVSSASHYNTWLDPRIINNPRLYFSLWRYKVSKLANVLFTFELNRRLVGTNARAFAIDPGLVNTEIGLKGTSGLSNLVWRLRRGSGQSPEIPAKTILYLGSEPSIQNSPHRYWYNCQPKKPSAQSHRPDLARELWDESCRLCGIAP